MDNKTAMQELIEKLSNYDLEMIFIFKDEIDKALEKEKEQIIDFHVMLMKNGLEQEGNAIEWDYNELKEEALKYYNQTYKQDKECQHNVSRVEGNKQECLKCGKIIL